MAHVLQAYLALCSRDPRRVRSAQPVLACAAGLPANRRERLHIATVAAVLADDYEGAKTLLGELLRHEPRDVLALQVAHAFDYATAIRRHEGAPRRGAAGVVRNLPGYSAVLASTPSRSRRRATTAAPKRRHAQRSPRRRGRTRASRDGACVRETRARRTACAGCTSTSPHGPTTAWSRPMSGARRAVHLAQHGSTARSRSTTGALRPATAARSPT